MARDLMAVLRRVFGLSTEPEPEDPDPEMESIRRRQDRQAVQIGAIDAQIASQIDAHASGPNHHPRRRA